MVESFSEEETAKLKELTKSLVELGKHAKAQSSRLAKLIHPCVDKLIFEKSRDSNAIGRTLDFLLDSMMFGDGNRDFVRLVNYYSKVNREGGNFYHNYALDDGLLSKMKYLNELRELDLPEGEYAIFGDGPLAIRGIKSNSSIELLTSPALWSALSSEDNFENSLIKKGHIQIRKTRESVLIKTAEQLGDFFYVKLPYVLETKCQSQKKKDENDVRLIREYLSVWSK